MSTQAAFVLGLCIGVVVYWIIYRIYWGRWRFYLQRDQTYLQEKVKSAEFTSLGLERQLNGQKGDLAALRLKINDLERENRQSLAKLEEARKEKEALVSHLDILRVELAGYKKAAAEPAPLGLTAVQPANGNGKTREVQSPLANGNGKSHEPYTNGNGKSHEWDELMLLPELVLIPANGAEARKPEAPKNGTNGRVRPYYTPEFLPEPELYIARPRMDGDRLEIIPGIGPKIVKKLRLEGIDTFSALAKLSAEEFRKIVGGRAGKLIDAEGVIEQAKKLARERK